MKVALFLNEVFIRRFNGFLQVPFTTFSSRPAKPGDSPHPAANGQPTGRTSCYGACQDCHFRVKKEFFQNDQPGQRGRIGLWWGKRNINFSLFKGNTNDSRKVPVLQDYLVLRGQK